MTDPAKSADELKSKKQLVHELKSLRRQVAESDRLLAELILNYKEAPIGLCVYDLNLRYVHINYWLAEINGLPAEEHLGREIREVIPEIAEAIEPLLRHVMETGESIIGMTFKAETPARPGFERTFQDSYYPFKSGDSTLVGVSCVVEDITARMQAEELLRESEKRLSDIAGIAPVGIFHTNADGDVTYVNEKWCQLGGMTSEAAMGKGWLKAIHPDDLNWVSSKWYQMTSTTKHFENEYRYVSADGEITWCYVQSEPILDEAGDILGYVGALTDITSRKQIEEQLSHSQRMDAMGQLTGGVAHDFNNLMAVMIGNAGLLEEAVGEDEEAKQSIEAIKAAVERGASLTSRLLAFSRQSILSPVTTDVSTVVDGLDNMLRRTLGETIDLRFAETSNLWSATMDPYQFEIALINLAFNARDAMPRGGTLTIEIANITLDETYAAQQDEVTPGDYVKVEVSDSGTGITPEVLGKVFEPFFTTKEAGKGSGLGLSMVYGFVKQSMGHITIYSEVGHGTTVKLYLPRSEEVIAKEGPKDDTWEIARGSERILVVEDDEHLRSVPVRLLRKQGYHVVEAIDGKEALERLRGDQQFDLLFSDVVLPGGMNGVEIAEEAKRIQPGIKVLFTTGYAENAVVHNGMLDQDVTLLSKPYPPAKLLEKVRDILDEQSVLLIEDDKELRTTIMNGLKRSGYSVATASGGVDGLKLLKTQQFDVVVTDVVMHGGEGIETLGWIKQSNPDIPVIGISGHSQYLGNFKKLGASATLKKPFTIEDLVKTIREVTHP